MDIHQQLDALRNRAFTNLTNSTGMYGRGTGGAFQSVGLTFWPTTRHIILEVKVSMGRPPFAIGRMVTQTHLDSHVAMCCVIDGLCEDAAEIIRAGPPYRVPELEWDDSPYTHLQDARNDSHALAIKQDRAYEIYTKLNEGLNPSWDGTVKVSSKPFGWEDLW